VRCQADASNRFGDATCLTEVLAPLAAGRRHGGAQGKKAYKTMQRKLAGPCTALFPSEIGAHNSPGGTKPCYKKLSGVIKKIGENDELLDWLANTLPGQPSEPESQNPA
jgi:hypothetical protein